MAAILCPDRAIRSALRHSSRRSFHASSSRYSSPFFALAKLSNSRETQHLNKLSKLSRVEHSPNLQLIQSSEVEPFGQKPSSSPKISQDRSSQIGSVKVPVEETEVVGEVKTSDTDLLSIGRAILAEKNEQIQSLQKALEYEKDRSVKREASYVLAREKSKERIHRLNQDVSSAKVWKWFLIVMGGSYAAWTYLSESVNERKDVFGLRFGDGVVKPTTPIVQVVKRPQKHQPAPEPRLPEPLSSTASPASSSSLVSSSSSRAANTSLPTTVLPSPSSSSQQAAVPASTSSSLSQSRWTSIFWKS